MDQRVIEKIKKITVIPPDFSLHTVEEVQDRHVYSWVSEKDPNQSIWMNFSGEMELLHFVRKDVIAESPYIMSDETRFGILKRFCRLHAPADYKSFQTSGEEWISGNVKRYTFQEFRNQLPLPETGYFVDIHHSGLVLQFMYYGFAEAVTETSFVHDEETVLKMLFSEEQFQLKIAHHERDQAFHLVWEPVRLEPSVSASESLKEPERTEPFFYHKGLVRPDLADSFEALCGIDATWTAKNERMNGFGDSEQTLLSPDGRTCHVVRAGDGEIRSLLHFNEGTGMKLLNEQQCEELAVAALFARYGQTESWTGVIEESPVGAREVTVHFTLWHEGLEVKDGTVSVSVDRTTGRVSSFMGLRFPVGPLSDLCLVPEITAKQARTRLLYELKLSLCWEKCLDETYGERYELVYASVFKNCDGDVRFVDAHSGELLMDGVLGGVGGKRLRYSG